MYYFLLRIKNLIRTANKIPAPFDMQHFLLKENVVMWEVSIYDQSSGYLRGVETDTSFHVVVKIH
ncbi:hypothetical protein [Bacillus sp. 03113]|uniref:hypothetical protein n=1 Tax=Bacillus sp. 03113 TaxID=2578211 RepID=UPI0015E877DC|nr:hypothetical protein [Bacillus sp. 03113]